MAGTLTVTSEHLGGGLNRYRLSWTSTSEGAVSAETVTLKRGELVQVRYTPGSSGDQPTDEYDVQLQDSEGFDVLGGTGADLSNAAAEEHIPTVGTYFRRTLAGGEYELVVANAGNAKSGVVELLVQ